MDGSVCMERLAAVGLVDITPSDASTQEATRTVLDGDTLAPLVRGWHPDDLREDGFIELLEKERGRHWIYGRQPLQESFIQRELVDFHGRRGCDLLLELADVFHRSNSAQDIEKSVVRSRKSASRATTIRQA